MNHYINLLEPSECHYLSSAESNPLYKLGAVGILVAILGSVFLKYQGYQATIQEGEAISSWLAENEASVAEAKSRLAIRSTLQNTRNTIETWGSTRYNFPAFLNYLVEEIPQPADHFQFTNLQMSEDIIGLTKPRDGKTAYYPLERNVKISLLGRIKSERPEIVLDQYRTNLNRKSKDVNLDAITMRLKQGLATPQRGNNIQKPEDASITTFSAGFVFESRELAP
jgi:hypothetical protein